MPRRKIVRTQEEEEEFQRLKRERNAENQRKYRERKKESTATNITVPLITHNSMHQNPQSDVIRTNSIPVSQIPIASTSRAPSAFIVKNVYCASAFKKRNITSSTLIAKPVEKLNPIEVQSSSVETMLVRNTHYVQTNTKPLHHIEHSTFSLESHDAVPLLSETRNCEVITDFKDKKTKQRANTKGYFNIEYTNLSEHYIGKMNVICQHCQAKHFQAETVLNKRNSFNDCCSHGKFALDPLPSLPDELQQLFHGSHDKSKEFFDNIRIYNNSFSFASFNANLVNLGSQRRGPYCFEIQGQVYYQINTALYPGQNDNPSYGLLFILDGNEAIGNRLNSNARLNKDLLCILDDIIRKNNIFAQSYQMMHDEIRKQESENKKIPDLKMAFINNKKTRIAQGRYNPQRCNEVAATFSTNADGDIPDCYVTIVNKHDKTLKYVSTMDPNVEPWIYPLYYPYGTPGWYDGIKQINGKRVTRSMYVQYRMAIRDESNVFLRGKRLFQQWLVDNYVKIEKDRINWCHSNQKQLRIEKYQGLIDHLEKSADMCNARLGRVVILPSTFVGSPKNMMQNYQDSMAIVRKYGKPDIFLTMTCNPNWKEIKENLLPMQQPSDRPDICARVFEVKKNYLIDLITRQNFFGKAKAFVYVIEFQKRGLPHIHLLITLDQSNKINNPESVDKYISAEIPDPVDDEKLHDIVMKNMIHGPCGDWCMVDGKCSKHFPKPFKPETTMDENGYAQYRRRENGISYEKSERFIVDNRHVVPYCPVLSTIFNCHINVEIVSSITSVKYLYKYIYKGHDSAAVVIGENAEKEIIVHDEITDFVDARYVGPVEAYWRITSKHLQEKSHTILRLPVHLPDQQNIVISDHTNEDEMRLALDRTTMLMEYFRLNERDVDARQYSYPDIPLHYVFKKVTIDGNQVSRWEKRQSKFNCIGRMYSVSPTEVELFHLRILLLNVKGATSYDALKTVNGKLHDTFTSTCLALGLIEDDEEWKRALNEASVWMMPKHIRLLFVRILMHCQPLHPKELWVEFQHAMFEDHIRRFGETVGLNKAYAEINLLLKQEGWDISKFPEMEQSIAEITEDNSEELQNDTLRGQEQYNQLNTAQKVIVDYILEIIDTDNAEKRKCVYVDGPGGLPVPLFADSTSYIKVQTKEAENLKRADVFIWDEAPMAPRYALEVMDRLLRDVIQNDLPFGGKIIILGGDFRQLLPVQQRATRTEIVNLSIKFSPLWFHFKIFSLKTNMRVMPDEQEFAEFLLKLGSGFLNNQCEMIEIPQELLPNSALSDIVKDTFEEMIKQNQHKKTAKRAILSARNADVEELNKHVFNLLDETTERIYTSVDSAENTSDDRNINQSILTEYLNSLNPPSLPSHELRLKTFAVIMLIRNLNISEGLCNGTRLLVLELGNNILKCEILSGDKAGDIVFLNRITLFCEELYPFILKRRQFPIQIAFAMTINKSQGQTFDKIVIDLRKDVFSHGQIYVAFSRVKSWDSSKVYLGSDRSSKLIKNYVYKEILN